MSAYHLELSHTLQAQFGGQLQTFQLTQDALVCTLINGVVLTMHIATPNAYSLSWAFEEQIFRIDTAPTHPQLTTHPNHLHHADGRVLADPLTQCGAPVWHNVTKVMEVILSDPLLQSP